jgi:succinate dehydrogenase/fumarate reductase flavoprotein subunit
MLLKGGPGRGARSTTAVSGRGFAAALPGAPSGDSPDEHFRDTLCGGEFLNDQRLVRIMVDEAPQRIAYLETLGVEFERDASRYRRRQAPGHSHPRSVMAGDMGQLLRALGTRVRESGVEVLRGLTLAEVLVADGRAAGALCFGEDGRRLVVQASATILATGGFGRLYPVTSNPPFATGDGHTCGYRAGARLRDMEFIQFTPAGLLGPAALRGWSINHELLWHPAARIRDHRGEARSDFGPERAGDLVHRLEAIRLLHRETRRVAGAAVRLDLRDVPRADVDRVDPALAEALATCGMDLARDLLEIAPEAHFSMGGLDVDEWGATSLPGLFAVGEAAGGCHGANRLTHNAFPEVIVFAPRAGQAAGERARSMAGVQEAQPAAGADLECIPAPGVREALQEGMLVAAGPIRSDEGLEAGLAALQTLRSRTVETASGEPGELLAGLATRNLLDLAEIVLRAALRRTESRGAHFREDHPQPDDRRWLVSQLAEHGADGPQFVERRVGLSHLHPEAAPPHRPADHESDGTGQPGSRRKE